MLGRYVGGLRAGLAARAGGPLRVILIGVAVTLPVIAGCTVSSYRVFRGKADALTHS